MKALDRSLVGCKKCERGYPPRDMPEGLCVECWQKMSDPERAFLTYWRQLAPLELPDPVREYRFDEKRKWRLDLAFPDVLVAVELHGATYARGRHTRGGGFAKDREKMNAAQVAGWIVLEFPSEVLKADPERCVRQVADAIIARTPT